MMPGIGRIAACLAIASSLLPLLASASAAQKEKPRPDPGLFDHLRPFDRTGPQPYDDRRMVYTYIDMTHASRGLAHASSAMDMLALWSASWARHGWLPRILTREDVERDPGYHEFVRVANSTATRVSRTRSSAHGAVDATFRLRGLTQFYAKAVAGSGVLTDSDVINYGLTPQDVADATAGLPQGPRELVVVHDARNCKSVVNSSEMAGGHLFRAQGYADGSGVATRGPVWCVKTNNGLTSGSGGAYHRLLAAMLRFQQESISKYGASDDKSSSKMIGRMTEMRELALIHPH